MINPKRCIFSIVVDSASFTVAERFTLWNSITRLVNSIFLPAQLSLLFTLSRLAQEIFAENAEQMQPGPMMAFDGYRSHGDARGRILQS
jgi:hypothetical protein